MDKKQAIEYLKESLEKIPHLASLPYENQDYPLWCNNISDVLEDVFSYESTEYKRFSQAFPNVHVFGKEQEEYLVKLAMRKTAILSIIQKHETLGFKKKSADKGKKSTFQKIWYLLDYLWQVTVKAAFEGIVNGLKNR